MSAGRGRDGSADRRFGVSAKLNGEGRSLERREADVGKASRFAS